MGLPTVLFDKWYTVFSYHNGCYLLLCNFLQEIWYLCTCTIHLIFMPISINNVWNLFSCNPLPTHQHSLGNNTSTMKRVQMLTFPSVLFIIYFAHSKSCNTAELLIWTNGSYLHQYKQAPVVAAEYLSSCASWCMATDHCVMLTWSPGTCWQVAPIGIGEPVLGTVYVPRVARGITGEVDIAKVCHVINVCCNAIIMPN